jgi:N-acetylglucosamine kinase-like BadF-type ATPase
VVVAGTGTGFGARSASGDWARASGCEYLLSDEGGGFALGLSGLRAAVRALDGRGPGTVLLPLAMDWCRAGEEDPLDDLCRKVYVPSFKPVVAGFAEQVLRAAPDDGVASGIVAAAADELAEGACAAARSAGCLDSGARVRLSGSLLTGNTLLTRELERALRERTSVRSVQVTADDAVLDGFGQLREAWLRQPAVLARAARAFPVRGDIL